MDTTLIKQKRNWIEIAKKAWELRKKRLEYEALEKAAFEELKQISNNAPSTGGGFLFNYSERKGSVDYSSIEILQNIDLDAYRKPSTFIWKLEKI